jgi:DNA repair protein RecO (recombination protein O)
MLIEALVIKTSPTREHDKLVTLYSPELGKITAIAKSALKHGSVQALQLDAGNHIRCELVSGHGMPIITGAQAIRCFSGAKSSPVLWAAAQFFLQVVDVIVYDQQPDQELWTCLTDTLAEFDRGEPAVLATMRRRQDELLGVLGYGRAEGPDADWSRSGRIEMDDAYERIAQRRLGTLDLFYDLVR